MPNLSWQSPSVAIYNCVCLSLGRIVVNNLLLWALYYRSLIIENSYFFTNLVNNQYMYQSWNPALLIQQKIDNQLPLHCTKLTAGTCKYTIHVHMHAHRLNSKFRNLLLWALYFRSWIIENSYFFTNLVNNQYICTCTRVEILHCSFNRKLIINYLYTVQNLLQGHVNTLYMCICTQIEF